MDEQNPGVATVESTPPAQPYKDRSAGLVVFGILTILLGCLAGLFIPLMLVGQLAAVKGPGSPPPISAILPAMLLYVVLAAALVWLGIGSVMARRWARALLLIFSWSWLAVGIFAFILVLVLVLKTMANLPSNGTPEHPAVPAAALGMVMVVMAAILGVFFIILPAIWMFFYNSRHVKTTCETRDVVVRWTDACPLPVLGLSLWLAFGVPALLITPIAGHGVMPFFGMFLRGLVGGIFALAMAAVWGYSAWALYKLERRGWWLIFVAVCLVMISSLVTFSRHDILEMYRLMDYPETQIEQMQKSGLLKGNQMAWFMGCFGLPFLAYLVFIRKYIFRSSPQPSVTPS